ncbi:serine/threonine protein kinase [Stachybotrys elegans]|uniref:non-specific serine/threonine protein kinase n=1 Tax=Stachybotrys elegans TaxID=80388 RepID=A0A8K0WM33_9HYPO|nr:serine/threonine protein kinase [Stachybotrys elegans]
MRQTLRLRGLNQHVHLLSHKDIEEGSKSYGPGGFHPVYVGDIYNGQYEVLNKLGYGVYSTVWLARNLKATKGDGHEFVALKILSAEAYGTSNDIYEREILKHLRNGNKRLIGYAHVCHLLDDFEHRGPNGTHVVLVFEPIGETLRSFGAWFPDSMIPNNLMRRFTIQLLLALDFAHDQKVIHTDIQPSNIFVKMQDQTRIEIGYLSKPPPHQDRTKGEYTIIPSRPLRQYYFDKNNARDDQFNIVLGDWGVASWVDKHLTEVIQPVALRAPEVLIGAPWDASADMWNLGAIVLEMFRAIRMFSGEVSRGQYKLEEHLAEIVHLCGPFPKSLLERGDPELVGRIFDKDGTVKGIKFSPDRPTLSDEVLTPGLDKEVRDEFLAFMKLVMKIEPKERPTPEDVLRGPWLRALR